MIYLDSSAIHAVHYDPSTGEMQVWFPNGGPYTYYHVPQDIYEELVNASSAGTYFNKNVRGRFR